MPESTPMSVPVVPAARAVSTVPAAVESSGARVPGVPAAVRGTGALTRWETVRAVMRLELVSWNQVYLTTMIGLILIVQAGIAAHRWLGMVLPLPLVLVLAIFPPFLLLTLCGLVCLTLWDPSRSSGALRLYGALPVTRSEVLPATTCSAWPTGVPQSSWPSSIFSGLSAPPIPWSGRSCWRGWWQCWGSAQ